MQYLEHSGIYDILVHHQITAYFRYVDDILIIYINNKTDIIKTIEAFNQLQPSLKFTMELENKNKGQKTNIWYIQEDHCNWYISSQQILPSQWTQTSLH
jgi:hypothetical protein